MMVRRRGQDNLVKTDMNTTLILYMIVPLFAGVLTLIFAGYQRREAQIAGGAVFLGGVIATVIVFAASHGLATSDTEIWNGKITSKDRVHGSYVRTYECNCTESCSGTGAQRSCTKTCQTCTEDHYTVNWDCASTVGKYTIDSKDWTSSSVYMLPNPQRWTIIKPGDPVARTHSYTNYVQAVPESLFKPSSASLKAQFASLVPAYPDQVFDYYKLNRFLTPGYNSPDAPAWNAGISELLKDRGPTKQVNVIVVVAKTADANYVYALQDAWEGANKNDVVLVIGSAAWPKIDFVDVISWTKRELFKVQLRDNVMALGQIQRDPILGILAAQIDTNFERRHMKEFKYLSNEIDPPTWLLAALGAFIIIGGIAGVWFANGQSFYPRTTNNYRRK
jgi:hypothetical protein